MTATAGVAAGNAAGDRAPRSGYVRGKQLAAYLGTTERTLWRWVQEGRMPKPINLAPRFTVWQWAGIHEWIEARAARGSK